MAILPIHHKPMRISYTSWWDRNNGNVAIAVYAVLAVLVGYCIYWGTR